MDFTLIVTIRSRKLLGARAVLKSTLTIKLLSMVFAMFFMANLAYAEDICEDPRTSSQANVCAEQRYNVAETALNTRYKQLLVELDAITKVQPERLANLKSKFIVAQIAWAKYRESECNAIEVWYTNGTLQPALYFGCMERLTKERISVLDEFTGYQT